MKRLIVPLTLLAVLPVAAWMLRSAEAAPALKEGPPKWEYKAVHRSTLISTAKKVTETDQEDKNLTHALNMLGDEGWQLAEIDNRVQQGVPTITIYLFRRPK